MTALKEILWKHVNEVHEKLKLHKCDLCQKHFSGKGKRDAHIETVHQKLRLHPCDICKKNFS